MQMETWLVFLATSVGLSLSPGPNGLLALTHGAIYGHRKTLFTIFGGAVGFVVIIALSMFGIGALIRSSVAWLAVLKWVGGAYLVWLGIQVWRSPSLSVEVPASTLDRGAWSMFQQGALSAVTNPKGLLFFTAFLPHFIDPHSSLLFQFFLLAGTFVATEVLTEYLLASAAHRVRPWIGRTGRKFNKVCGGVFVAIGAALPLRT